MAKVRTPKGKNGQKGAKSSRKKILVTRDQLPELQKQLGYSNPRKIAKHVAKNNMYLSQRARKDLDLK